MTNHEISSDLGWLLNPVAAIDRSLQKTGVDVSHEAESAPSAASPLDSTGAQQQASVTDSVIKSQKYKCNPVMFEVQSEFMMNSQHERMVREREGLPVGRKKIKKRKQPLNPGEEALVQYYEKVGRIVEKAHKQLLTLARARGFFKISRTIKEAPFSVQPNTPFDESDTSAKIVDHGSGMKGSTEASLLPEQNDNNQKARKSLESLESEDNLDELCREAVTWPVQVEPLVHLDKPVNKITVPVNTLYSNPQCTMCTLHWGRHEYLIPPKSTFLMSDASHLHELSPQGEKFDVIVMDPPWENKSVKRKKCYNTLCDEDISDLPVGDLLSGSGVVLMWVTNKQRQHQLVTDTLFKQWGLEYHTHWYWLKVTQSGEPVCPLDSPHKKPFEAVIIGARCDSDLAARLPKQQVMVSVPAVAHSRKPPLHEILEQLLPSDTSYLELFARNLLPNWTSWGNQVLKFQHKNYFNFVEKKF